MISVGIRVLQLTQIVSKMFLQFLRTFPLWQLTSRIAYFISFYSLAIEIYILSVFANIIWFNMKTHCLVLSCCVNSIEIGASINLARPNKQLCFIQIFAIWFGC